ncbi:MAG: GNAT family N-acetyltransferase [Candidatus Cloacimonetes bacterium]|nr:GNAT family N-acetyltransferase [Candidatus Cloacimonadota bacterium]
MRYYKKLVGSKCYLSPISPDDAELFTEWLNDIELTKYLAIIRNSYTVSKEKEILEEMAKNDHAYVIVDIEINKPIGIVSIFRFDHINNTCELGLFIGDKDYWNLGYGEEATRLLLDFAFTILNINNVMLLVIDFNVRAIKCYEKIGFKEIGRRRQAYHIAGRKYDIVYMDILNEEFDSTYLKQMFSDEYEASQKPKKIEMV